MIDAFLEDGNEYFDPTAFNDFLHAQLGKEWLVELQREMSRNAFVYGGPGEWPLVNHEYLAELSHRLQNPHHAD